MEFLSFNNDALHVKTAQKAPEKPTSTFTTFNSLRYTSKP